MVGLMGEVGRAVVRYLLALKSATAREVRHSGWNVNCCGRETEHMKKR